MLFILNFQCNLGVVEKELVVAPKFVQRFTPLNVNEGEPITLSVRAVGTPIPRITWQKVCNVLYIIRHFS